MMTLAIVVGLAAAAGPDPVVAPGASLTPAAVTTSIARVSVGHGVRVDLNAPGSPTRGCPEIVQHPEPMSTRIWHQLEASVVATGSGLTYQWRKDGVELEDDGRITGSRSADLVINPARGGDYGLYDVVVTSGGCSVESGDAEMGASCYPGCHAGGPLTLADFGCFQTRFALGDMYTDCDEDGLLTLGDFGCFMTYFALGCPW